MKSVDKGGASEEAANFRILLNAAAKSESTYMVPAEIAECDHTFLIFMPRLYPVDMLSYAPGLDQEILLRFFTHMIDVRDV